MVRNRNRFKHSSASRRSAPANSRDNSWDWKCHRRSCAAKARDRSAEEAPR